MFLTTFLTISLLFYRANAFASPSIPPPPSLSLPVWSLACPLCQTSSGFLTTIKETQTSMNIVTYAIPVSVAPPKLWVVSLYKTTLTKRAFVDSNVGILQLLSPSQSKLVPILGKRSGYEKGFSKREACADLDAVQDVMWRQYRDCAVLPSSTEEEGTTNEDKLLQTMDVLPNCVSYIKLKLLSTFDAGDHDVALCEVIGTGEWLKESNQLKIHGKDNVPAAPKDQRTVLYSGQLREEGII